MADSVDNRCSIAFDPMPEPPMDEEGTLIPQKRLFEKQDWKNARDFYAAIVDRFQLRENSYRVAL